MKHHSGYCLKYENGALDMLFARPGKGACTEAVEAFFADSWDNLKLLGYSIVKITMTEVL